MSRKVGIIGMGHVGSTVAHGLIAQGAFDDYVLIDINEKKVTADAVDFRDAAANLNQHANIVVKIGVGYAVKYLLQQKNIMETQIADVLVECKKISI